jgi:hypothetical protein
MPEIGTSSSMSEDGKRSDGLRPPSYRAHPRLYQGDIRETRSNVRTRGAGSTGRRNTGIKSLCWRFKLQGLSWSFV